MPRSSLVVMSLVAAACGKGGTPASSPAPVAPGAAAEPAAGSQQAAGSPAAPGAEAGAGSTAPGAGAPSPGPAAGGAEPPPDPSLPRHARYATLADALRATIPAAARVVGFGEIHARVDRAQVRSALAAFTEALPSIGERISDLVVETWIVDPKCGKQAATATQKIETDVKRPEATKSEIALLADAARAAKIQPHAMTLTCKDYERLISQQGDPDPIAMLGLVTRELTRIAASAVKFRDREAGHRPWIALYGGALHNDRFPAAGVAEWSYAAAVDAATGGRYVEIDVIVPEFAEPDKTSQAQPWFPLVAAADRVLVWTRGERSFVVLLPRTRPRPAAGAGAGAGAAPAPASPRP